MKKISVLFIILLTIFLSIGTVSAQDSRFNAGTIQFEFNEDEGEISATEIYENDYLAAGENLFFSGKADDIYMMGKNINYEGNSSGGMIAFAKSVDINGVINKNLHSAANSIRISGTVNETAFMAAQNIVIGKDAIVNGSLISASKNLHIIGKLENGLIAAAGEVVIDGPVSGNVKISTGKLIITERGSIEGNVSYGSGQKISEKEKARITGTVNYKVDDSFEENSLDGKEIFFIFITVAAFFYLSVCIGGLLLLLLPGIKALFTGEKNYLKTLLWGLIPLFIYPVAIIVTLPLLPLSIALILALFPLLGLSTILGLTLSGKFLFRIFKWKSENVYLQFLFAFAVFIILTIMPFIKILSFITVAAIGSGVILSKLFKTSF